MHVGGVYVGRCECMWVVCMCAGGCVCMWMCVLGGCLCVWVCVCGRASLVPPPQSSPLSPFSLTRSLPHTHATTNTVTQPNTHLGDVGQLKDLVSDVMEAQLVIFLVRANNIT
jgi:hypothetical protein